MNEIEQKEIEEMAIIDCQRVPKGLDCSACQFANVYNCNSYRMATRLYNAGYKNCKDKVVVSKEELNTLIGNIEKSSEIKAEELDKARKETAREILQELKTKAIENGNKNPIMGARVSERDLCEFAKEYGVEVE